MTYSEYKNLYNTAEEFHIAVMKLSDKEVKECFDADKRRDEIKQS